MDPRTRYFRLIATMCNRVDQVLGCAYAYREPVDEYYMSAAGLPPQLASVCSELHAALKEERDRLLDAGIHWFLV